MRRDDRRAQGFGTVGLLAVALTVVLGGCGTVSGPARSDAALTAGLLDVGAPAAEIAPPPSPAAAEVETAPAVLDALAGEAARTDTFEPVATEPPAAPATVAPPPTLLGLLEGTDELTLVSAPLAIDGGSALAQSTQDSGDGFDEEYDPWEPFNEKMFSFNRGLDRWVLKPTARAYMFIMPEPWQVLIANGFDNINFVPRFVNSLLQGKWAGAGRELSRFLINSTAGIGGLFDPAKDYWGIDKSREDFGQTLGVWGSGPGPYLVLPFMEPLTVRDGFGKLVDTFMDPLTYVLPFFWDRLGMKLGATVNERALNYELFQGFEESVIDMYSAVRHGYLQRRKQLIKE